MTSAQILIFVIIALIIGWFIGSIKNKTIKSLIVCSIIVGMFLMVLHVITQPIEFSEERSYISDTFKEIPGSVIELSEPMKITVTIKRNDVIVQTAYKISTIDENVEIK